MPNRILREGIISSEAVCGLSWAAEVFYRRLFSVVDDYGRFHATPALLRAACYPLQLDRVSDADIVSWLTDCCSSGLIISYEVDGKKYLEVLKFQQHVRAKRSKFPSMHSTCSADAMHMRANAHEGGVVFGDEGGVGKNPVDNSTGKQTAGNGAWWKSEAGIKAKGVELQMPPGRGESWHSYKARLFDRIAEIKDQKQP